MLSGPKRFSLNLATIESALQTTSVQPGFNSQLEVSGLKTQHSSVGHLFSTFDSGTTSVNPGTTTSDIRSGSLASFENF